MRAALPCTSPTRRLSCASARRRVSVMMPALSAPPGSPRAPGLGRGAPLHARPAPAAGSSGHFRGARGARCRCSTRTRPHGCAWRHRAAARAAALEQLRHRRAELRGRLDGAHARRLEGRILVGRRPAATGHDGTRVAHPLARRCGHTCDVGDDRLAHVLADVTRRGLLTRPSDLADENDALGAGVALKEIQHVDEAHARHRVAADAYATALTEAGAGRLKHGFVGQRARTGDDPDGAFLVNEARHDADLAFLGSNDTGTIGTDQPCGGAGQHRLDGHHVLHRDTLGNAHHELDARIRRLEDRVGGAGRGHVDHARGGTGGSHGIAHRVEHRQSQVLLPTASGRYATDQSRAVSDGLLGVERALLAGKSLADDPRVAVDENAHALPFAASATTLRAASVRSSAGVIFTVLRSSMARAASALVPSSLTTTGTLTPTFFTAWITPSAIRSQRTMPPKMLTSTARTR